MSRNIQVLPDRRDAFEFSDDGGGANRFRKFQELCKKFLMIAKTYSAPR